jgi:hypothetical protein
MDVPMIGDLDPFWVHTVTVTTLTGTGGMGDVYAAPAVLVCFVDDKVRLVRGPDAREVVSSSTVYAPAGTTSLTPGSLVDLPSGRRATIITTAVRDSGGLDLPDHVEAALT